MASSRAHCDIAPSREAVKTPPQSPINPAGPSAETGVLRTADGSELTPATVGRRAFRPRSRGTIIEHMFERLIPTRWYLDSHVRSEPRSRYASTPVTPDPPGGPSPPEPDEPAGQPEPEPDQQPDSRPEPEPDDWPDN